MNKFEKICCNIERQFAVVVLNPIINKMYRCGKNSENSRVYRFLKKWYRSIGDRLVNAMFREWDKEASR